MADHRRATKAHAEAAQRWAEARRLAASYPSLYLHCYATARGVRLHAYVDQMGSDGKLRRTEIAQACWQPKQVTERLVVEWGERALRRWLETNLGDGIEAS